MGNFVPEGAFDLLEKLGFAAYNPQNRVFKQCNLVGQHKGVASTTHRQWNTFIEAKQDLALLAQLHFDNLLFGWVVCHNNGHVFKASNILLWEFVHGPRNHGIELLVGKINHLYKYSKLFVIEVEPIWIFFEVFTHPIPKVSQALAVLVGQLNPRFALFGVYCLCSTVVERIGCFELDTMAS